MHEIRREAFFCQSGALKVISRDCKTGSNQSVQTDYMILRCAGITTKWAGDFYGLFCSLSTQKTIGAVKMQIAISFQPLQDLHPLHLTLDLLLLSSKYLGIGSEVLHSGQGLFMPCWPRQSLQKSLPHFPCCHGSTATWLHFKHLRSALGCTRNL